MPDPSRPAVPEVEVPVRLASPEAVSYKHLTLPTTPYG